MKKLIGFLIFISAICFSSLSLGQDCNSLNRDELVTILANKTRVIRLSEEHDPNKNLDQQKSPEDLAEEAILKTRKQIKREMPQEFYSELKLEMINSFKKFNAIPDMTKNGYTAGVGKLLEKASVKELQQVCESQVFEDSPIVKKYIERPDLLPVLYFSENNKATALVLKYKIDGLERLEKKFGAW